MPCGGQGGETIFLKKVQIPPCGDTHLCGILCGDKGKEGKKETMPNQRKKDKKGISVYVPDKIKAALAAESKRRGIPMSELVTEFYKTALEKLGYDLSTTGDTSHE